MRIFGTQSGWALNDQGQTNFPHSLLAQLPLCTQAGIRALRFNFRLGQYYQDWTTPDTSGATALDKYDRVVAAFRQAGIELQGLLSPESLRSSQSLWAASPAEHGGTGDNLALHSYAQTLVLLAKHYPEITHWECWNEPNVWTTSPGPGLYSGGSFMYPSNFAWLLTHCAQAVANAGLAINLISGGITSFDWSTGSDYLQKTARAGQQLCGWGNRMPVDLLGQHLYIQQGKAVTINQVQGPLLDMARGYKAVFGTDCPPISITELGWQQPYVSAATQADNLQTSFSACKQLPNMDSYYWFNLQDQPDAQLLFGLYDQSGQPKPTYNVWKGLSMFPSAYTGAIKEALDIYWNMIQPPLPKDGDYATVFQQWVAYRLEQDIDFGPLLVPYKEMHDWNSAPIRTFVFPGGRAEQTLSTGKVRWWLADCEVTR